MQHHIDEFSVSDIRHTLNEGWRVIRDRRPWFVFPFLGVSALAFFCSLWVPRSYSVSTTIRREHDPVLASMMGRSWTEPYGEIRARMASDLADLQAIEGVLAELNLPDGLERFADGTLSPGAAAARSALAAEVAAGLSTKSIEASANRDVVAIRLTLADPAHQVEILRGLRDRYVSMAAKKTTEVLRSVEGFFQAETTRCRSEVAAAQKALLEMELKHPGINPDLPDPTLAEQSALMVEGVQAGRELEDLRGQRARLEASRAGACPAENDPSAGALPQAPNPRYSALQEEIEKLGREIDDCQTGKGMTAQHPVVQRLLGQIAARYGELDRTPMTIDAPADVGAGDPRLLAGLSPMEQLEVQIAEVDGRIALLEARAAKVREEISRIERSRAAAVEQREAYFKLREKAVRSGEELGTWQQNLGPIHHLLTVESSNRGLRFTTVREAEPAGRPSSPDPKAVAGMCLAIGAAVGALMVLLVELMDRSFRTVRSLNTSLGIPVIESVNEIVTEAARRRRLIRRLVVMPTAAVALGALTVFAAALAYLSLESPADYELIRRSPHRLVEVCMSSS